MVLMLWHFGFYSFLGWCTERIFAWLTHSPVRRRRCLLFLPMCPVYGLSMALLLILPQPWLQFPCILLAGLVLPSAVEYGYHWAGERLFRIRFWDYSHHFGNLHGRICLSFSLAWVALVSLAVTMLQPFIAALIAAIPPAVSLFFLLLLTADTVCSLWFLSCTHDLTALRYAWG